MIQTSGKNLKKSLEIMLQKGGGGGRFFSRFDEFVPEQSYDTLVGSKICPGGIQHVGISEADKHCLWHNCFQVEGDVGYRGIRHLLWRTLGQAKCSRLTLAEMKTWLERIMAWCTSSGV
jgi:hypothetical protein